MEASILLVEGQIFITECRGNLFETTKIKTDIENIMRENMSVTNLERHFKEDGSYVGNWRLIMVRATFQIESNQQKCIRRNAD